MYSMKRQRGSVSGLLLAGMGVFAVIAATVGIAINNRNLVTNTQASVPFGDVRIEEGSVDVDPIDKRSVDVEARLCFGTHISSGTERYTVSVVDASGQLLDNDSNEHITTGKFDAGFGFPAPCEYTNTETGEAKLNSSSAQGRRVSLVATFGRDLSDTYCPDVYLNYSGTFRGGRPFAKIRLSDFKNKGVCQPGTSSSGITPPAGVTGIVVSPTITPIIAEQRPLIPNTIEGIISVYSCQKPDSVRLIYCDGATCNTDNPMRSSGSTPQTNGIWLDDSNTDSTWIYRYRISQGPNGGNLDAQKMYEIKGTQAVYSGTPYWSQSEDVTGKLFVRPGAKRDFEVDASRTCGCSFKAIAYVKDVQGNYVATLDGKGSVAGTHNNKQRFDNGDIPVATQTFNNLGNNSGRINTNVNNLVDFNTEKGFGHDALASVKLIAPGYKVLRQECKSNNQNVPSCPTYTSGSSANANSLYQPEIFQNLRVTCGTDLEYGWIVEEDPDAPMSGKGNLEVIVAMHEDGEPASCDYDSVFRKAPPHPKYGGESSGWRAYRWIEKFRVEIDGPEKQSRGIRDNSRVNNENSSEFIFENISAGNYHLDFDIPSNYLEVANRCDGSKDITIKPGETTKIAVVLKTDPEVTCDTATTCSACKKDGGNSCGAQSEKIGNSSYLCCKFKKDGGGEGGGPGACWPPDQRKCTGTAANNSEFERNPQARCDQARTQSGETYGTFAGWCGPSNNACCDMNGSGGGNPPPPSNPGPGGGGTVPSPVVSPGDQCAADGGDPILPGSCPEGSKGLRTKPGSPFDPRRIPEASCSAATYCKDAHGDNYEPIPVGSGYCCKQNDNAPRLPILRRENNLTFSLTSNKQYSQIRVYPELCRTRDGGCYASLAAFELKNRNQYKSGSKSYTIREDETRYVSCDVDLYSTDNPFTDYKHVASCSCPTKEIRSDITAAYSITLKQNNELSGDVINCHQSNDIDSATNPSTIQLESFDLDDNGIINAADLLMAMEEYGNETAEIQLLDTGKTPDVNGDGVVNAVDLTYFIVNFGKEIK